MEKAGNTTPGENIEQAVKTKNYDQIKHIIGQHPDLVNMIFSSDKKSESLMANLLCGDAPLDIIQYIVSHPKFDFHFVNSVPNRRFTNSDAIFQNRRKDVLDIVIHKPEMLAVGEELTYTRAKHFHEQSEQILAKNLSKMKTQPPKLVESFQEKFTVSKLMISMIRDATIKRAIATDDPSWLDKLEAAGDNLKEPLGNGRVPFYSLSDSNDKLYAWFPKYLTRTKGKFTTLKSHQGIVSLNQLAKIEEALTKEHHENLAKIHQKAFEARLANMDKVLKLLG